MTEELILDVKLEDGDNEKQLQDLNQLIAEQKTRLQELTDAIKVLAKTEGASSEQVAQITKQRDALSKSVKANSDVQKNLVTIVNSEKGSVESLNAQNKILTQQRNLLGTATQAQKDKITALNGAIDANVEKIKNQSSKQEQQRMNIGNYIKTVEVGGVSLEGIASKFASPYVAAGAALGGLFKLYSQSKQGAQDLELAQVKLNSVFQSFADNIGALGTGKDGKGVFSKMVDGALLALGLFDSYATSIAAEIKVQADKEAQLMEIRRARFAKTYIEQSEQQKSIRDDEAKTRDVRISAARAVLENVQAANKLVIATTNEQLEAKKKLLSKDKENLDLQIQVAQIEAQQADISESNAKREIAARDALNNLLNQTVKKADQFHAVIPSGITDNNKTQKTLDKIYKDQQLLDKQNYLNSAQTQSEFQTVQFNSYIKYLNEKKRAAKRYGEDTMEFDQMIADAQIAEADRVQQQTAKSNAKRVDNTAQMIQALDNIAGTALTTFKQDTFAYKAIAIAKALMDSYLAANAAFAGSGGNPIAMFAALALGLANVANITGIAAAGGADFYTSQPTLLLVGDNPGGVERVTVEPVSGKGTTRRFNPANGLPQGVAMAGGGMLEVNRAASATALMRNFNNNVKNTQTVLVLQDFELAQAKKDTPINRAKVLSAA